MKNALKNIAKFIAMWAAWAALYIVFLLGMATFGFLCFDPRFSDIHGWKMYALRVAATGVAYLFANLAHWAPKMEWICNA